MPTKKKVTVLKSQLSRKAKTVLFNFKVTPAEKAELKARANKFTNGNITALVKYCALRLNPRKRDLASKTV